MFALLPLKNQGNKTGLELEENLRDIIPHKFGDHSLCSERFCGEKRSPGQEYAHMGLSHNVPQKDDGIIREVAPSGSRV